jgi:hypothetical protein
LRDALRTSCEAINLCSRISYPVSKLRSLCLSSRYPWNRGGHDRPADIWELPIRRTANGGLAAHMERRHKLYVSEPLPVLLPIHAWWNSLLSRGKHLQQTISPGKPESAFRLACSLSIVSWLNSLSVNIQSLSTASHFSSPWRSRQGFPKWRF